MVGVACALGGLGASAALGQVSVPTPTITVPTVSVPSVTVPVPAPPPPVPTVPVPTPPAPTVPSPPPAPVPTVPVPTVRTPTVTTPGATTSVQVTPTPPVAGGAPIVGGGSSGSTPTAGGSPGSQSSGTQFGSSAGSPPAAVAAAAGAAGAPRGRVTRSWIAVRGADKRKQATLVFRLRGRASVEITVVQVSPVCRVAAKFRVGGHAGKNRVTIGRGAHGTQLTPGTYRVVGRTRAGRTVLRQTIVVVQARAPSAAELASARRSNVCAASGVGGSSTNGSFASASLSGPGGPSQSTITRHQRQSDEGAGSSHGGLPIASGIADAVKQASTNPVVIGLLVIALLIFGVAALPRTVVADPRMMAAVAAHRAELAVAGAGVLAVAVIAMLVG
jgi:hypothetical protein